MTVPYPEPKQFGRRVPRWLAIVAAVAVVGLLIVLLALLLRRWGPQPKASLWLSPAASPVDDTTAIALSGSGWQPGERVALCLNAPDDDRCDDARALAIATADQAGAIQADIVAGVQLAQGQTTFAAQGLDSDRRASRSFRVLKIPGAPTVAVASGNDTGDQLQLDATDNLRPDDAVVLPPDGVWTAEYFANTSLSGPAVLAREDGELAFNWGAGSPDPLLPADGFSARWVRSVSLPGGSQRFSVQADGGVRLFVDGQRLIDQWQDDGLVTTASAAIDLPTGEHTVQLEYFQQQGNAAVALSWATDDTYPDWRGEYFSNPDVAGQPALVRDDADPNLDWGEDSPAPGSVPADGFSVRWTRALDFAEGVYRFALTADDGARLLLDGQPLIDAWQDLAGETRTVDRALAGGQHQVTVLFRDLAGPARIAVGWSPVPGATPVQVAVGVATPTPAGAPTSTVTPGGAPSATPTSGSATLAATESATPASSVTAEPTATAGTPGAATATLTVTPPGGATAPPGETPSPTPSTTPAGVERRMDINPIMGYAGTRITITSGNWSPGTQVRVALLEQNAPFSQAQDLPIAAFTTPSDSSQSFSLSFQFPDDSRWLSQTFVRVLLHSSDWSEWADELFDIIPP